MSLRGTVIGALQNSAVLDALFDVLLGDTKRLRHDASKFIHLGSATIDHYVCIARADAPVKSFKELLERELIIGASQPGTSTRDYPAMGALQATPRALSASFTADRPFLRQCQQSSSVKNRMREICTSGSVGGEDGNILTYPATIGRRLLR